jgi:hypothetical protein
MTHQPENAEDFDHLLDQALQSYASTEPRLGLEDRILAHAILEPSAHQWQTRNLLWFATAALTLAIAVALIVIGIRPVQKEQQFTHNTQAQGIGVPRGRPARPTPSTIVHVHAARPVRHSTSPTPEPQYGRPQLTQQDRLVIQFAALHTKDALALARRQQTPDQPIPDQPIADAPLHVDPIVPNPIVIAPVAMESKDQASF